MKIVLKASTNFYTAKWNAILKINLSKDDLKFQFDCGKPHVFTLLFYHWWDLTIIKMYVI